MKTYIKAWVHDMYRGFNRYTVLDNGKVLQEYHQGDIFGTPVSKQWEKEIDINSLDVVAALTGGRT